MIRTTTLVALAALAAPAASQWDPANGDWLKSDAQDVRVMTWNVEDGLCRTNPKVEGINSWHGLVCIVAALRPDVLVLQECGDNSGNGTGSGGDSVAQLEIVLDLFFNGGSDPFLGGSVTSYVQKYAPGYDLDHVFVSSVTDGLNRNVVLSRWPFADLNGDSRSTYSDIPFVSADAWAPGGNGGIRGFQLAEIDLPDASYQGDFVVGNAHLKASSGACTGSCAHDQRIEAAKNAAYVVQYWYNGLQIGIPDPIGKISDVPPATSVLDDATPVVLGGDWNENPGPDSPSKWLTEGQWDDALVIDGTDRDGTDMTEDQAVHPLDPGIVSTKGSAKFDYLAWQDSVTTLRRAFLFDSAFTGNSLLNVPPELLNFSPVVPWITMSWASDHLPVIADLELALAADCNANGVADATDIAQGTSGDQNGNQIPDECEGILYCTAKTNSLGCVPQVAVSGTPGASEPGTYDFSASNVLNFRNGLPFYGVTGSAALPFLGGTLCVAPPLRRLPILNSGGSSPPTQDCSGQFNFDFNALIQSGADPLLVPGQQVNGQWWSRDPAQADGTGVGLSSALEFVVGP